MARHAAFRPVQVEGHAAARLILFPESGAGTSEFNEGPNPSPFHLGCLQIRVIPSIFSVSNRLYQESRGLALPRHADRRDVFNQGVYSGGILR